MRYLKAFFVLVALALATTIQAENCHIVYNKFVLSDCGTFDCDGLVTIGNEFGCTTTVDRNQGLAYFDCPGPEAENCEEGRCVDSTNPAENCYIYRSFVNDIFERVASSRKKTKPKTPADTQKQ